MADDEPKVLCKTPTPGKQGTRIPKWKYDSVRAAIRKAVPKGAGGVALRSLPALVKKHLPAEHRKNLGSVSWHFICVKLDLEVRGELERIRGSSPQRIRRVR